MNYNTRICTRADSNCSNTVRMKFERNENATLCQCSAGCVGLGFMGDVSTAPLITTPNKQTPLHNFTNEQLK